MLVFPFIAVEPLAELATDGVALDEMEPDPASPIMSFIFPIFSSFDRRFGMEMGILEFSKGFIARYSQTRSSPAERET